jgi:hypothetical protein
MWSVPHSELKYPIDVDVNSEAASMATPQGVVLLVPDSLEGGNMRIGTQRPLPERDITSWKELDEGRELWRQHFVILESRFQNRSNRQSNMPRRVIRMNSSCGHFMFYRQ